MRICFMEFYFVIFFFHGVLFCKLCHYDAYPHIVQFGDLEIHTNKLNCIKVYNILCIFANLQLVRVISCSQVYINVNKQVSYYYLQHPIL